MVWVAVIGFLVGLVVGALLGIAVAVMRATDERIDREAYQDKIRRAASVVRGGS